MSKLALILCFVVFTLAEGASNKSLIETAVEVEKTFELIQKVNKLAVEKFRKSAIAISDKTSDNIRAVHLRRKENIAKLGRVVEDIIECGEYSTRLTDALNTVHSNMRRCLISQLHSPMNYFDSIDKFTRDQIAQIDTIDYEFHLCSDYKNDDEQLIASCHNAAREQIKRIGSELDKVLKEKLRDVKSMLVAFESYAEQCIDTNGRYAFRLEASTAVENTRKCIRKKIKVARKASPSSNTFTHASTLETDIVEEESTTETDIMEEESTTETDIVEIESIPETDFVKNESIPETDIVKNESIPETDIVKNESIPETDIMENIVPGLT